MFDPLYDWWEDHFGTDDQSSSDIWRERTDPDRPRMHVDKHHAHPRHHRRGSQYKRRSIYNEQRDNHPARETDYYYYRHHVHKDKHKHGRSKNLSSIQQGKKERETMKGLSKASRHNAEKQDELMKQKHGLLNGTQFNLHARE